jgi:hypothetical protein
MDSLQRFLHLMFLFLPCTPAKRDISRGSNILFTYFHGGGGGVRNRVGIGLPYGPVRQLRLVGQYDNSVPTRFLVTVDCSKIPLQCFCRHESTIKKSLYPPPPPSAEKTREKEKD